MIITLTIEVTTKQQKEEINKIICNLINTDICTSVAIDTYTDENDNTIHN